MSNLGRAWNFFLIFLNIKRSLLFVLGISLWVFFSDSTVV